MLVVADEDCTERTSGTRREIEFALRAWLSPLPTPTVDRFADVT